MATQTIEFRSPPSQTVTLRLFVQGSDTQVASASATEATNRKGTYTAVFSSIAAGEYQLIATIGTSPIIPVASGFVTLTLTTATFYAYAKVELITTPPTAAAIADAVWDEAYSGHTTAGTFGKLMDILRKSNNVIEGTILASPTPTTTVFKISGANYPTGALEHSVLWMSTGTSAEQNSPILTTVNNGDGTHGNRGLSCLFFRHPRHFGSPSCTVFKQPRIVATIARSFCIVFELRSVDGIADKPQQDLIHQA